MLLDYATYNYKNYCTIIITMFYKATMTENKYIENKQQVTPEIKKGVVAFLNASEGGSIYIDIEKMLI